MRHVRTADRQRWRFKVTLGSSASFTADVSQGGFCTELMRVLPPATRVRGSLEGFGRKVPFEGRVVWSSPGDQSLNVRGRMGISFTEIGPGLLELFETRSHLSV
jgi:PilZ domain